MGKPSGENGYISRSIGKLRMYFVELKSTARQQSKQSCGRVWDAALLAGAEVTKKEFDQAIEAIRQGQITPREVWILPAAVFTMRELSNMSEDQVWEPTHT